MAIPFILHSLPCEADVLAGQVDLHGDELTARENLRFFAQLYGLDNPDEWLAAALTAVGLNERLLLYSFSKV